MYCYPSNILVFGEACFCIILLNSTKDTLQVSCLPLAEKGNIDRATFDPLRRNASVEFFNLDRP